MIFFIGKPARRLSSKILPTLSQVSTQVDEPNSKHKRVAIRFRPQIDSSRVGVILDPSIVPIRYEFQAVPLENARNRPPEASLANSV